MGRAMAAGDVPNAGWTHRGSALLSDATFFYSDEPHQAARAISLSHGVLRARMGEREYGAEIDENALGVMDQVDQIRMKW